MCYGKCTAVQALAAALPSPGCLIAHPALPCPPAPPAELIAESASTALGGVAAGNLGAYLPLLLQHVHAQAQNPKQLYQLLKVCSRSVGRGGLPVALCLADAGPQAAVMAAHHGGWEQHSDAGQAVAPARLVRAPRAASLSLLRAGLIMWSAGPATLHKPAAQAATAAPTLRYLPPGPERGHHNHCPGGGAERLRSRNERGPAGRGAAAAAGRGRGQRGGVPSGCAPGRGAGRSRQQWHGQWIMAGKLRAALNTCRLYDA